MRLDRVQNQVGLSQPTARASAPDFFGRPDGQSVVVRAMPEIAVAAIVFFAALTQGIIGFGFGMVSMGLLPLVLPPLVAIPFVSVYAFCVAGLIAWQMRAHISWKRLQPVIIGCTLGVPLGLLFLKQVEPHYIRLALGVFLILFSIWSLAVHIEAREVGIKDRWGYVAGFFSGILGGAFNSGGPPAVVYTTLKAWEKDATKSTLQMIFVFTGIISIGGHFWAGRLTADILKLNLFLVPAIVLGVWLGGRLYARIDQAMFYRGMLLLLFVVGIVFVTKAVSALV
ncbi:MAG: putative membrane protein YfcA [Myxococcota bacterium]|jgi:uncharacterized membrane protein YfcA